MVKPRPPAWCGTFLVNGLSIYNFVEVKSHLLGSLTRNVEVFLTPDLLVVCHPWRDTVLPQHFLVNKTLSSTFQVKD